MEVKYCGNCTLPPEYCRYNPNKKEWKNCLQWLQANEPQMLEELAKKDQVIANDMKKMFKAKKEKKEEKEEKKQNDNNNNNNKKNKLTTAKIVKDLENKVNKQQEISNNLMNDIESSLSQLTTTPQQNKPLKGILKNTSNKNTPPKSVSFSPELDNESDEYDDDGNKIPTNLNSNRAPPKKTKKKRRRGKRGKRNNKNDNNDNDDNADNNDDIPNNNNHKREPLPPPVPVVEKKVNKRDKKNKKKVIEVLVENRKGNKKATVIRGLMELGMKAKTAQSAFRKKFATGVGVQQSKSFNGKEIVLQGDLRYDLMKFLRTEYKVPPKLLFYRTKRGLVPAVSPEGFVMPP